jgi:hypothetical protein
MVMESCSSEKAHGLLLVTNKGLFKHKKHTKMQKIELYHLTTVLSAQIQWRKLWNICFCIALLQAAVGLCST